MPPLRLRFVSVRRSDGMSKSHEGIASREARADGRAYDRTGRTNCPDGLDNRPTRMGRGVCHNCGRQTAFVRATRRNRAHWQHVGDGLVQYRNW